MNGDKQSKLMIENIFWFDSLCGGIIMGLIFFSFIYYFNFTIQDMYNGNIYFYILSFYVIIYVGFWIATINYNKYIRLLNANK